MERKSETGRYLQRFIPARVIFVIMGFVGFNLVYAYKVVLSMSIIAMVNKTSTADSIQVNNSGQNECSISNQTSEQYYPGVKFDWDSQVKSQVLSAFFYGYILTQIPAGILASKFGGKWIFGLSIFIAGICSIVSPFSAKIDYRFFMAVRIIQGLAEGVVFPCMSTLIAQWMPTMERTRGTTIIQIGSMIGTVITIPIAGQLCISDFMGSWEATFYLLGITAIVWFVFWTILVYESPETHPFISQKEMNYILNNGGGKQDKSLHSVPYREILTSVPVYALIFTNFGQNWGFLTVLNLMPSYMDNVLHMNVNQNMIISGLPFLGQAIFGVIVSYFTDIARDSGRLEITTIRKINSFIAYIPSAICLILVPIAGCDTTFSSILLILAITFNGACFSGFNSTHVDLAPDHAGTLMGITNGIGNIPGFLATIVAGYFTRNGETVKNWSYVFYISSGVFVLTTIVYIVFATAREQPWGRNKPNHVEEKKKEVIMDNKVIDTRGIPTNNHY